MTIADTREKCKSLIAKAPRDMLVIGILILASTLSFGFGYLAGVDAGQGSADSPSGSPPAEPGAADTGSIVASKNGTKYYPPGCAGAARISDSNKVWFVSAAAAEDAGYSLAANCTSP